MEKKKVVVLVDGFNLYHAIEDVSSLHKFKWLDLSKLAKCFQERDEVIKDIYYFTALVPWDPAKKVRHEIYIKALEAVGVKTIYGAFRKVQKKCRKCNQMYLTYEEKQTDVNIAIQLFKSAIKNEYDRAIIISGDSDLIPAITTAQKTLGKGIRIVIPIGRRAEELKMCADSCRKLKPLHLSTSQFNDELTLESGEKLERPPTWK